MFPKLLIGPFVLPMYTLMAFLGIIAYAVLTVVFFEKYDERDKRITNRFLIVSVFGFLALVCSAFLFDGLFHLIEEGRFVFSGITWLGGFVGMAVAMIFMIHYFVPGGKGREIQYFSLALPGITLGHAFGRVGCFLGGCCYGRVTTGFLGIVFPPGSPAAIQYPGVNGYSLPVLPTQLFEAVFELILAVVMIALNKRMKHHNFHLYAIAYGIFRFLLEFLRGDDRGSLGFFLTPSQVLSLLVILFGILLILFDQKKIFLSLYYKMEMWRSQPIIFARQNTAKKLAELQQMRKNDLISEEEYQTMRNEILKDFAGTALHEGSPTKRST